ncbi:peptidoglycan editing factor PgeF [Caproiciproducens galactitolivorans]|uniref:Purine nucleoside phosphorylase n=1 Tax=Caproiciproducens galactitolivorans TaxID=642589 RepID=A0ABT4BUR4_9FIRM|nr:peptidoglycan editing factor PgeF [Caproiciproducens galactitolivorans]MCY1714070.1 peptidoglycan editing factor PgeF [Caproiciproducens galactitolivorans]
MNYDSKNMKFYERGDVAYLTFPAFEKYGFVRHAFSTRIGGVSENAFASMNLNFGRGDRDENVTENFHRFCSAAGFDYSTLVASSQDHGTFIRRVGAENRGTGIWKPKDIKSVDGLVTDEPDVTLVTYYADCVPLFFLDPVKRAIGLAHAGWRGTVAGIGAKMVKTMEREFGSRPEDLVAAVGPSIGPCCFEVDAPVYEEFSKLTQLNPRKFIVQNGGGKYHIDLWEANRCILIHAGIQREQITIAGLCTQCNAQWLWSHRASGGKRGGLAAMMCLTEGKA